MPSSSASVGADERQEQAGLVLALSGISKAYGRVQANRDISLELERGSVHALLGENGAGKSTLMKILFGVERPDAGRIVIDGTEVDFRSPRDAIAAGIGMVFQHFGLVQELTALDNIVLGAEVSGPFGVKRTEARERIARLADEVGLPVPLERRVSELTIAQQQRVEILKSLARGARILILDEPTALLAPQERVGLFEAIERLQAGGTSVLFITHKLEEVERLADAVTVIRHGAVAARRRVGEASAEQLITDMVGRASVAFERQSQLAGEAVFSTHGVSTAPEPDGFGVRGVTIDVRRREILGVVGIDGHGHQRFCQLVAGVVQAADGTIDMLGRRQRRWDRRRALTSRVSYVPEDRLLAGVARDESIAENLISNRLNDPAFVRAGWLRHKRIGQHADEMIERFDIRCRDRHQEAGRLSGGNVQKIVLAREISIEPEVLVVCEPTRGLDIGAIANVHERMVQAAAAGAAVVFQSSDLEEVLQMADRIVVFREGSVVAEHLNTPELTVATLGAEMLGSTEQELAS